MKRLICDDETLKFLKTLIKHITGNVVFSDVMCNKDDSNSASFYNNKALWALHVLNEALEKKQIPDKKLTEAE